MENLEKIRDVMRNIFDDETLVIDENSSPDEIADWDSFANIQLLAALEQEFGIRLTTAQATAIHSVGDFLAIINS